MKSKIIITFFIVFIYSINSVADGFYTTNYTTLNGLISNTVLTSYIDTKGFIWIGTAAGVSKFDGKKFINWNEEDGLTNNVVRSITEDNYGNIWLATTKGVSKFNGRTFTNFNLGNSNDNFVYCVYKTAKGVIYLCSAGGLFIIEKEKPARLNNALHCFYDIVEGKDGILWAIAKGGLYRIEQNKLSKIDTGDKLFETYLSHIAIDDKNNVWINTSTNIYLYNGKTLIFINKCAIPTTIRKVNGYIWVSSYKSLAFFNGNKFIAFNNLKTAQQFFDIGFSKENIIWVSSNAGLIKIEKKPFTSCAINDSVDSQIWTSGYNAKTGDYWYATSTGLNRLCKNKPIQKINLGSNPANNKIYTLNIIGDSVFYSTSAGNDYVFYSGVNNKIDNNSIGFSSSFFQDKAKNLYIFKSNFIAKYSSLNKKWIKIFYPKTPQCELRYAAEDKSGNLLITSGVGLLKLKNDTLELFGKELMGVRLAGITNDNKGNIWIATQSKGIYCYNGDSFTSFSKKDGLSNNFVNYLLFDKSTSFLWLATDKGITRLLIGAHSKVIQCKNYGIEDGFEINECAENSISTGKDGEIFVANASLLYQYNAADDKPLVIPPTVSLSGIKLFYEDELLSQYAVNASDTNKILPTALVLPYSQNYLTLSFTGISFSAPDEVKYKWKLEGFDDKWSPASTESSATYSNLPYGIYTFMVKACNKDKVWSKPLLYSITIKPPFYLTWWFITLCALAVGTLIYLIFKSRINKIKKQEADKSKSKIQLAEAELKALKAQMNPHFMFNVLNSIQDLVLDKDEEQARIYLADFAALMRMTLENSGKKSISLAEELKFINLYLSLEKMRFGERFNIEVNIDENMDTSSIYVPPMLIQPFIENAIIHGLAHKKGKGNLFINFSENESMLICTVNDDGVGRERAKELSAWKQTKKGSMGLQITNERIDILNTTAINKYAIRIQDLKDATGNSLGTNVELKMPL